MTSLDLYPAVELPVSTSTPMLSSLVHWDHTDSWPLPAAANFLALGSTGSNGDSCSSNVEVDVSGSWTVLLVFHQYGLRTLCWPVSEGSHRPCLGKVREEIAGV